MDHVVAKDFKTANRKFKVGDGNNIVTEADIEGRVTFDVWKERGFIKAKDEVNAESDPAPALKTWASPKLPARGED